MWTWRLSWRLLRRDHRAGELRLLAASLIVAVAAMTSVGFFADRVRQGLELNARQLLGADFLLIADHPWSAGILDQAQRDGLSVAETRTFPSMVTIGDGAAATTHLADIKAVTANYPLRGQLRIAAAVNLADAPAAMGPAAGIVWIDERLATALAAAVGDSVAVGGARLRVGAILTYEPDRGMNFFSLAPRLMMNMADLDATGLIQVGSRVSYRLLVAGTERGLTEFRGWLTPRLGRGERVEDAGNARPEIRSGLDRAQAFLGLAAALTVVLAAVAVALAARRYVDRHLDACAVMRCLGATQATLLRLHAGQFLALGIVASGLGTLLGFAAQFALQAELGDLLASDLPAPSWLPAGQGAAVGLLLLFGFAVPPLLQLKRVPTLRVIRRELAARPQQMLRSYAVGLIGLIGLMVWIAGDVKLGSYVVAGLAVSTVLFALTGRAVLGLCAWVRRHNRSLDFGWRYGIAALARRAGPSVLQIVALALGFTALILLTVTRGELLDAWRHAVPAGAPNRFVINIQADQVDAIRRFFAGAGQAAELSPMVRGRLTAINGRAASADSFADERARRLVDREFNLSWRADLPTGNTIRSGRWFGPGDEGRNVVSIEEGLAKTLGLRLGDKLRFAIGGEGADFEVVGTRKLAWDSMQVNFFVLAPPGVLERFPASYVTSIHVDRGQGKVSENLVREFPNLTVIDVGAVIAQLQATLDKLAGAVQLVFALTLAAGLLVLYAAFASFFEERVFEIAVMRSLGARQRQIRQALAAEFAIVGGIAGFLAAIAAMLIGELLARMVFDLEFRPSPAQVPLSVLCGALLVLAVGLTAARPLLRMPPLAALRRSA
jgi:putative ABC transport system permease protein